MARSSGPVQSGWRQALRWSMPGGQRAHPGDAVADLLAEQHPAAAGLGALAEHDLDRVGLAQVVGVHPVAAGQVLVDEVLGLARAPPGSCRRRRWSSTSRPRDAPRPSASLAWADSAPKLMPAMVTGMSRCSGKRGVAVAEHDVGAAALAVALQRVARHARAEEQQVVEVRQGALGAPAADVVDAGLGGALDARRWWRGRTSPIRAGARRISGHVGVVLAGSRR